MGVPFRRYAGAVQRRGIPVIAGGRSMQAGFSFTNADERTYFDSSGLLQTAIGERTNEQVQSEDFTAASWTKQGAVTVTANQAVAPDGTTTMDLVESLGSIGTDRVFDLLGNGTFTNDAVIAPSFYIKRVSTSGTMAISNAADSSLGLWTVNLASLSDDVERITKDHPAVNESNAWVANASGNAGFLFSASGGSGPLDVHLWGAQLEEADSVSDYIKTTTAPVTRSGPPRTTYIDGVPYLWLDGAVTEISGRSFDVDNWTDGQSAAVAKDAVGLDGEANSGFTVTDSNASGFQTRENRTTITSGADTYYAVVAYGHEASFSAYPEATLGFLNGTALNQSLTLDRSDGTYSERSAQGAVVLDPIRFGDYWVFVLSLTDNASGNTAVRQNIAPAINKDGGTGADSSAVGSVEVGVFSVFKDNFSLMPILTTGGNTKTVAADVASLANSVISGLTEGTLYMEIWTPQLTSNAARHIAELESDANNFIRVFHAADGDLDAQITDGGVSQATLAGTDLTVGELQKVALTFKANEFSLYRGGTQLATDTSGTMPSVDTLLIGAGLYGGIKTMNVHTTAWSQAKAEALTT